MSTLLIIEDDVHIRGNLRLVLGLEGFRVIEAETGGEGLALALRGEADGILCDVMLPEIDGFEILARLRNAPAWRPVPFIFLSARADSASRQAGLALGASDYLTKPFALSEVISLVRRHVDKASP
ncbi:response regulator [Dechloromonas sp. XY25]|uniref:Response regulator n=1 Tax=Dechloromonas hankyongensis TaxID=2908002 RepID=A0ABS9JX21_9RHOO|nr:response regulator [Dechloromonas hankyongensis]MCG2575449.1 response regulator [Dechloromonas hankyongensis]